MSDKIFKLLQTSNASGFIHPNIYVINRGRWDFSVVTLLPPQVVFGAEKKILDPIEVDTYRRGHWEFVLERILEKRIKDVENKEIRAKKRAFSKAKWWFPRGKK